MNLVTQLGTLFRNFDATLPLNTRRRKLKNDSTMQNLAFDFTGAETHAPGFDTALPPVCVADFDIAPAPIPVRSNTVSIDDVHRDLVAEFHRLNATHFDGSLKMPAIILSKRKAYGGYYQPARHRIVLSWQAFEEHGWDETLNTFRQHLSIVRGKFQMALRGRHVLDEYVGANNKAVR